jgi:hypothetical protein
VCGCEVPATLKEKTQTGWRRRRDSNPRDPFESNGFQDRRFQPLTHSSVCNYNVQLHLTGLLVTLLWSFVAFWRKVSPNGPNLLVWAVKRKEARPTNAMASPVQITAQVNKRAFPTVSQFQPGSRGDDQNQIAGESVQMRSGDLIRVRQTSCFNKWIGEVARSVHDAPQAQPEQDGRAAAPPHNGDTEGGKSDKHKHRAGNDFYQITA